jgi:hypothetical protein
MEEAHLTEATWREWCDEGLPYEEMSDGQIVLFDTLVDPWLQGREAYRKHVQSVFRGKAPQWFKRGQWYHLPFEERPEAYRHGPLRGEKLELAQALRPTQNQRDDRELERAAGTGRVWVRRNAGDNWEVWFREESDFAFAARRLKAQGGDNPTD